MSAAEPDESGPEEENGGVVGETLRHWGRMGGIVAALAMSGLFAVAAWYALQRADLQSSTMVEIPLIKADPGPVKEKPEDPGGLKIPNQDKLVFERITPKAQAPVAEKLAPAPEEPIVKAAETEAAEKPAPAAPVIAKPEAEPEKITETADKTAKKAAVQTKIKAKTEAKVEKVREHTAPPAITPKPPKLAAVPKPDTVEKSAPAAPKVESLLPAGKPADAGRTQERGDAPLPKTKDVAQTVTETAKTAVPVKSVPEKAAIAKPAATKAPVVKAPVVKAPTAQTPTVQPPAAKAAPEKALKSAFRIQIAAHRSAANAAASWAKMRKAHGAIIGSLTPHTERVDLGTRGIFFRVQAGNFKTAGEARAICGKLKAKGQGCIIVRPKK